MVDGLNTTTFTPDELFAGEFDRAMRVVQITGGVALVKGSVLGRTLTGGAPVGAAAAGNVGNGVMSGVVTAAGHQPGVYRIVFVEPNANLGTFIVFDPKGVEIGTGNVGVAFSNQVGFTIADGATDFSAGDTFTITVAAGVEKFKLSVAAAVDGSQVPVAILAQDTDVTGGDKQDAVYLTGEFRKNKLTFGAGHTAASTQWDLGQKNIYLRDTVA